MVQKKPLYSISHGRPSAIDSKASDKIKSYLSQNKRKTLGQIKVATGVKASKSTISRHLRKMLFGVRKLKKMNVLTDKHKLDRFNFALENCNPKKN